MIAIFAKEPVPGRVKTRLLSHLTPEQAAAVYVASMHDVIERAMAVAPVTIHYGGGASARRYFAETFPGLPLREQTGDDLGQRMANAISREFEEGAVRTIVLGTDAPTLPRAVLARALATCDQADLVFGPAEDGGYYLVGMPVRSWPKARVIFQGIAWSTAEVLKDSVGEAEAAGLGAALLDPWYDIDLHPELRRAATDADEHSHLADLLARRPELLSPADS